MKKLLIPILILLGGGLLLGWFYFKKEPQEINKQNTLISQTTNALIPTNPATPTPENKLCSWIDKSDIVIQLNFAEGVTKDTSYEAGFYYSTIGSDMRLARGACDYRTGFSYAEMKNKGAVQVGVRGFSDSNRRQLENEPVTVVFDDAGKPSLTSPIVVKVLN